nr:hypothetical protein [Paraburkholderia strydomiana]
MIIDSHYTGRAYRPFVGWYAERLSHVRRIVGADAAATDPHLADHVIKLLPQSKKGWLTLPPGMRVRRPRAAIGSSIRRAARSRATRLGRLEAGGGWRVLLRSSS